MKYRNSDFFSPEMINLGGDYVLMLFIYLQKYLSVSSGFLGLWVFYCCFSSILLKYS